jgi:hypothetical protein
MSKAKMGRPRLPEGAKGRVYTFWVPRELAEATDYIVERSNKSISAYLRDAVFEAVKRESEKIKLRVLNDPNSVLTAYLEGLNYEN